MSFWGSLFGGSSPSLNADIAATGQLAPQLTGLGMKNINTASNFENAIVSGDSSKINQVLSPQISAAKTSVNQDIKTNSMQNNRSGGTTAKNAASQDTLHGYLTNLVGSLTGQAASELGTQGANLLNTGLNAYQEQTGMDAQRIQNWSNSILGLGVTKAAGFGEGLGLNYIQSKIGGGGGDNS